ncbi:hypothetical protein ENSA5_15320 [Enhygromyxa salina]|uniref:YdhG-like domain-containing protein n=1 Tax=Enhygromyxa salina TaxID=215803 RepID=A0A2S9YEP8_9BACT|nr:DUF1801 domain-containing protein [Enhygromyxa salina]PRQ03502.1 hypothetical protein ENSA5_15320 [Enhygromyxa salina]
MGKFANTDAYLEAITDPDKRAALERIRELVAKAAPQAEECMSYGVPAFCVGGRPLVAYAAFKAHCGLSPLSPALIEDFAAQLEGFSTSKGTIRFAPRGAALGQADPPAGQGPPARAGELPLALELRTEPVSFSLPGSVLYW